MQEIKMFVRRLYFLILIYGLLVFWDVMLLKNASASSLFQQEEVTFCEYDVIVQADDWLSKIAEKFYGSVLAFPVIMEATNLAAEIDSSYSEITNPDLIEPGSKLCIPPAEDVQAMVNETVNVSARPPYELTIQSVASEMQADGTVEYTGQLLIKPLGNATFNLVVPKIITLGESSIVQLIITPDFASEESLSVFTSPLLVDSPAPAHKLIQAIPLYPIMFAELEGVYFEIRPSGAQAKAMIPPSETVWLWSLAPKQEGKQSLILSIFIEREIVIQLNEEREVVPQPNEEEVVDSPLKNIPIEVIVETPATPVPATAPTPFITPTATDTPAATPTPLTLTAPPIDTPVPPPTPTPIPTPVPFIDSPGGVAILGIIGVIIAALIPVLAPHIGAAKGSLPIIGIKAVYQKTLTTLYGNLARLQQKAALYGPLAVPIELENEIEATKQQIVEIEEKLAELETRKKQK
jgi:hypothetical protein